MATSIHPATIAHNLSVRIMVPTLCSIVLFIAAIFLVLMPSFKQLLVERKKEMVREMVCSVWSLVNYYSEREVSGELTRQQAQAGAKKSIQHIRYGLDMKDYCWINDMHPRMIMHPFRPELEGTDLTLYKDSQGKPLFAESVEMVKQSGGGYIDYMWQWKDDPGRIVPKISYVKGFKPWGWILGSGIYVEDLRLEITAITRNMFIVALGILVLITILSFYIISQGIRSETRRKQAEEKLLKSEQRLSGIVSALTDMIVIIDQNHRIVWTNSVAREVLGTAVEGRTCREVLQGAAGPCTQCLVDTCLRDGSIHEAETEIVAADGSVLQQWCTASAAERDEHGRPLLVTEVMRDVTERNMLQREAMRSANLAAIGELAAGVAHEINNPIMGIINFAQIISDRSKNLGIDTELSERIISEGDRIAKIVGNLLSFSRETDEPPEPADVTRIFDDSFSLVRKLFSVGGITVKTDFPRDLPEVLVRPQQVKQIVINVLSNALDALNRKYPEPTVDKLLEISSTKLTHEGTAFVRTVFHDHGIGIAPDVLEKICNPFFTTKPVGQGTGLGLSISHNIIKEHGGRLLFESIEGRYTRVIIDLPASEKYDDEQIS